MRRCKFARRVVAIAEFTNAATKTLTCRPRSSHAAVAFSCRASRDIWKRVRRRRPPISVAAAGRRRASSRESPS